MNNTSDDYSCVYWLWWDLQRNTRRNTSYDYPCLTMYARVDKTRYSKLYSCVCRAVSSSIPSGGVVNNTLSDYVGFMGFNQCSIYSYHLLPKRLWHLAMFRCCPRVLPDEGSATGHALLSLIILWLHVPRKDILTPYSSPCNPVLLPFVCKV